MKLIGIYKITNPNGKVYIGQTWDWLRRKKQYLYKGCKNQIKLYNSLLKYGVDNHIFEIIHELSEDITQEILDKYETMYWQQHKDNNVELLNIRKPGSRGKLSENTINKIKDKRKTFRHTEESKNKMRKPRPNMVGKATKSILCLNNNIIYPSVSKAALNLGLKQGDISNVLTNRQNSTKGYKFVYGK